MPRFRATLTVVYEYDAKVELYDTDDTEEMRAIDGRVFCADPESLLDLVLSASATECIPNCTGYMEVGVEDITPDEGDV